MVEEVKDEVSQQSAIVVLSASIQLRCLSLRSFVRLCTLSGTPLYFFFFFFTFFLFFPLFHHSIPLKYPGVFSFSLRLTSEDPYIAIISV